ncbi:MAG: hypothetical protein V3S89_07930 [Desulfobacterales bacterium]
MLLARTFIRRCLILSGVFLLLAGQSAASDSGEKRLDATPGAACLLCHSVETRGMGSPWSDSPLGQAGANCVMRRLDFSERGLVRNLLAIGYPLTRQDVELLEKTVIRFDSFNRLDFLAKILKDRKDIHDREGVGYFVKTETILDALRLLDEHDLPVVNRRIDALNTQDGWERREKALLAYMAAKRNIRYQSNTVYLLSVLPEYRADLESVYSKESFRSIIDERNGLSYLADLFASRGDPAIFDWLITYLLKTHGFPAENLSHMFVEMLLRRPRVFISALAVKDDHTVDAVVSGLIFGMRNRRERERVSAVLQKDLFTMDEGNLQRLYWVINRLHSQIDLVGRTLPKTAGPAEH